MAVVTTVLCPFCHKPNQPAARYCQHCGRDIILNNEAPSDGREYVITRVIKEGGQGAVYEAMRRPDDGRRYAIKEMLDRVDDPRERDEAITRFNAEAELLQSLDHPRIPRVYSHFTDSGRHYLAMDFIEGEDLEDVEKRQGAIPEQQVLAWADQICDVLGYLHRKGLVYRDMKPSNVMIERRDGSVKLVDFGIAKLFKPTERGTQIGTPGYAPPEQYQGIATPASDIYALGATLHHLLTGRDPRDDKPFDFPPPRDLNPNVSRRTSDAIVGALKMKPEDRWGSVAEMRALLRSLSVPLPPVQVRVSPPTAALPASAQVATPAAPSSVSAPPPARSGNGAALPRAAPPAPAAAPTPAAPRRRRFGFGRFLMTLLVLLAIAAGVVYVQFPALWQAGVQQMQQVIPTAVPTPAPLVAQQRTYNVQATLPDTADDATVRAALREAFAQQAQAEFGPSAVINANVPPSVVGSIDKQPADNGNAVYSASMQGFLLAPQQ